MPTETTESLDSITLPVLGMTCASCQHHVKEALQAAHGVRSAHVDLMGSRASVVFDPSIASPEALIEVIKSAGYDAVLPRTETGTGPASKVETTEPMLKAGVVLAGGVLAMLLAMPLGPEMGAVDRVLMRVLPWLYSASPDLLRWILLVLTAVVMGWAGRGIYASAATAFRHGTTNMNTLVSLGTGVAFLYSACTTIWPAREHQVYFDAVLLITGFLLLGKALEARAKRSALAALDSLSRLRPSTARRIVNGIESIVPLEEIRPGDSVVVLPGERFPVDGKVLEGRTTVDESMLTGESVPLPREPGDRVLAGSLNYDGAVVCESHSVGETTVLAQIARMVEQAQSSRSPMERLADRASAIFVPVVLGLAVVTFGAWMIFSHSFPLALANTVAVLVIACPCAMGLAVPAALTVAVGRGAQLGVLFKGGEALERLAHLDIIVLDKTGTLTVGHPVLKAIRCVPGYKELDLLRIAAAAEERSNHPLAHAIMDYARERGIKWGAAEHVQVLPGRGLTAKVGDFEGLIGNDALFREFGIHLPDSIPLPRPGITRLWIALDGHAAGCFDARDALRPDGVTAIAELRAAGLRVLMLTGDTAAAAAPIANELGIGEFEAGLDPAGKLARIRSLQKDGLRVGMVGDGINDAAALAQADAGIAMGSGADLTQEAGDVLLLRARPSAVPAAVDLARSTLRVMTQNLLWASGYNLLGIPLAAGLLYPVFHILLSPWLAAAAMALSSVSVLANSLRLRHWQPETTAPVQAQ